MNAQTEEQKQKPLELNENGHSLRKVIMRNESKGQERH